MEHTHASSEAPPEKVSIPVLPVRILQVFVSPAKLFDAIRERPAWLGAAVGLVVLSAALQLLTPVVVPEDVRRAMFESQIGRFIPPGADPELLDQQVEAAMSTGPAAGIATVVIATPIFLSLIAGLILIAFNVIMGGEGRFRQLFSAAAHATYVYTAGGIVGLALMTLGSQTPILTPGLFLPEVGGFIGGFLNGINIFTVWTCGVLGVAVSRIYPERSAAAGTTYLLVLYLIVVAVLAALASLLS
ncbi:YIP1 family protein [Candidatus Palauibacter sp.]|uniref:YIP1 family protein n=1 Tax=Candidatus Palauibacter sp. TaxID=3101350 RepID=UPI003AF28ECC